MSVSWSVSDVMAVIVPRPLRHLEFHKPGIQPRLDLVRDNPTLLAGRLYCSNLFIHCGILSLNGLLPGVGDTVEFTHEIIHDLNAETLFSPKSNGFLDFSCEVEDAVVVERGADACICAVDADGSSVGSVGIWMSVDADETLGSSVVGGHGSVEGRSGGCRRRHGSGEEGVDLRKKGVSCSFYVLERLEGVVADVLEQICEFVDPFELAKKG